MSVDEPRRYVTKTEVAFATLRELLLSGELPPGESLTYRELSERLNMSQTPVREAVRRLEAEGLLRIEPHKGVSVTDLHDLSIDEAQDLYLVRMLLEREAARLAARRITADQGRNLQQARRDMEEAAMHDDPVLLRQRHGQWHFHVHDSSGSPYLASLCASAWNRFPWEAVWVVPGRLERSMEQHRAIEEAILDRDPDAAARLMEEHVETGRVTVLEHLRSRQLSLGGW